MPIGTGKVGLFGGGIGIEAGSETFNAPGNFTVPSALKIVSLTGNGSTGNPGNPGNPGGDGPGGNGGFGGAVTDPGSPFWSSTSTSPHPVSWCINGNPGGIGSIGNPPGGPGNPGNPGGLTSALGYNWTCGAVGNGGIGGVNGVVGNPGTSGATVNGNVYCSCSSGPIETLLATGNRTSGGTGASNASISPPSLLKGGKSAYAAAGTGQCQNPCGKYYTKYIANQAYGGGGGSGQDRFGTGCCRPWCGGNNCFGPPWTCGGLVERGGSPGCFPRGGSGAGGTGQRSISQNNIGPPFGNPGGDGRCWQCSPDYGQGGGGGGSGGATTINPNQSLPACPPFPSPGLGAQSSNGGGGGGMGSCGNPGSGAGNPGSVGTPATYNSAPVTSGTYPVSVGTGGQIIISWNAQ